MLMWLRQRRSGDNAAVAREAEVLDGAAPRTPDEHATLRVIRDLQPAVFVPEGERVHERSLLLRAAEHAARVQAAPTLAPARVPDEPTLHAVPLQLGGRLVVLVDVEGIDEERVQSARNVVADQLGLRNQRRGPGE